jgi:hypothetical protein
MVTEAIKPVLGSYYNYDSTVRMFLIAVVNWLQSRVS